MATSQPNSPGDFRTVRARRSVAHTAKAYRTKIKMAITTTFNNKVFPSYKNTHFKNEAKCKTSLVKMISRCMRIKIIFIDQWTFTWPRFETEVWSNSEMAFYYKLIRLWCTILYQVHVTTLQ